MAIVTTPGGSSSNSFITVAEADDYLAAATLFDTSPWNGLNETQKEQRLIHAALLMKTRFCWIGRPVYKKQALPFPRWSPDEQTLDEDSAVIPESIKEVQAYIALDIVHRGTVGVPPASEGTRKPDLKRVSLFGSLDVTLGDGLQAPAEPSSLSLSIASRHWVIERMLSPYLTTVQFITAASADESPRLLDEVL
ncbi:MAG: DnaT-like ssDNA-binding protein [Pseudomonadota bacterium]